MNMSLKSVKKIALSVLLFGLFGCSSAPETHYYSLLPDAKVTAQGLGENIALGIGPVIVPDILDRPGLVSYSGENQLKISTYHIWAGKIDSAISSKLSAEIGQRLDIERIWAFPWDNRIRPEYQIRLQINDMGGVLGGEVQLNLVWTLLSEYGQKEQLSKAIRLQKTLENHSYDSYVAALNQLWTEVSQIMATTIKQHRQGIPTQ